LLDRVDRRAEELGMSRSSYFGFAANLALRIFNPRATMSVKGRMLQFGEDKMGRFVSRSGLGPRKKRPKA